MRPVIQEDQTGCGLASVATLVGLSYRQVKTKAGKLGINVEDPKLWSDTKYIRKLLASYNISVSHQASTFKSWQKLPPLALLAVKWHQERGCAVWHWVVYHRGPQGPIVLDSKRELRNHCRTDFGRIKPKWFLMVTTRNDQ